MKSCAEDLTLAHERPGDAFDCGTLHARNVSGRACGLRFARGREPCGGCQAGKVRAALLGIAGTPEEVAEQRSVVARFIDPTTGEVRERRRRSGKVIEWGTQPLGIVPDSVLARQIGVAPHTVRMEREARGLPVARVRRAAWPIVPTDARLGVEPDTRIAAALGVPLVAVRAARRERGVRAWDRTAPRATTVCLRDGCGGLTMPTHPRASHPGYCTQCVYLTRVWLRRRLGREPTHAEQAGMLATTPRRRQGMEAA